MKEINRQFVVFGNFNSLSFDDVLTLTELKQKYNFKFSSMPDIIQNQGISMVNPQSIQSRPIFLSEDKTINVFFGSSRIHIEQTDSESDSYDEFNNMCIDIIKNIINNLNLKFNRIAINGRFRINDKIKMDEIFNKIFKDSHLYNNSSKEWQVNVLSNDENEKLQCQINKIASFHRTIITTREKISEESLILGYDVSTQVKVNKLFNEEDINELNNLGKKYRKELLNMV